MARPSPKKEAAKHFIICFLTAAPKKRAAADDINRQSIAAGHKKDTFADASSELVHDGIIVKKKHGPHGISIWFLVSGLPRRAQKSKSIAVKRTLSNAHTASDCRRIGIAFVRGELERLVVDRARGKDRKKALTLNDFRALLERLAREL